MDPSSYPGGKPPRASGTHDTPVFFRNMTVHVSDIGEGLMAIGAPMGAGGVQIKIGLGGERCCALGAVSPGTNNTQARR